MWPIGSTSATSWAIPQISSLPSSFQSSHAFPFIYPPSVILLTTTYSRGNLEQPIACQPVLGICEATPQKSALIGRMYKLCKDSIWAQNWTWTSGAMKQQCNLLHYCCFWIYLAFRNVCFWYLIYCLRFFGVTVLHYILDSPFLEKQSWWLNVIRSIEIMTIKSKQSIIN